MRISGIKNLIKLVEESEIAELEVSRFGTRVRIRKVVDQSNAGGKADAPPLASSEPKTDQEKGVPTGNANYVPIKSPMVGTFYRAAAPDAPPYVEINDIVKQGQIVCIVEAMKLMNEIESEDSGRVVEILVKNKTPVEYGEVLFHLEPI